MSFVFNIEEESSLAPVIKVIGVGGGGCNAVDNMIRSGLAGVEFISANTDAQTLHLNLSANRIQLGTTLTKGLGAGARPEIGRNAAMEDRERIADALRGANMLFIASGMGGGTGTGASPVVAEVAKELGILTVAVVTRPFVLEGKRQFVAQQGIDELSKYVDSLIVIPNEKLLDVLGENATVKDCFEEADNILKGAIAGIAEIITCPGMINVDFADVKTIMSKMGMAMMGSAYASGFDRASLAADAAINSPLLEDVSLEGARGVLVNITTAPGGLMMKEYKEIMAIVRQYVNEDDEQAEVKFGTAEVVDMPEDMVRVTIVATGLGQKNTEKSSHPDYLQVLKTGTNDSVAARQAGQREAVEQSLDTVVKRRRGNPEQLKNVDYSSPEFGSHFDIPAFLRKQND